MSALQGLSRGLGLNKFEVLALKVKKPSFYVKVRTGSSFEA